MNHQLRIRCLADSAAESTRGQTLISRGAAVLAMFAVLGAATCDAGLFSSSSTGDWTTAAGWSLDSGTDAGGNGFPDTGDGASIAHAKTLNSNVEFGSNVGGEGSTWSDVDLTINSTSTLTHVAGSTLAIEIGDRIVSGNGTLINQGIINHNTDGRIDLSVVSLRNEGTYNFNHTGGSSRQMTIRNGSVFTNTGTVEVLGTREARFEFGNNNGRVLNDGGTLAATNGDIEFDGNLEVEATAGSQFNAANGRVINFSSAIRNQLVGTANVVGTGRVQINGISADNDVVINVGGDGLAWLGNISLSSFNVRNDGIMYNDTSGDRWIDTSGTFEIGSTGSVTWNSTNRVDLRNQNVKMVINGLFEDVTNTSGTSNLFTVRGGDLEVGASGHLLKSAGSGSRRIEGPNMTFTNAGIVEAQSGTLLFDDVRVQMLDFSGSTLLRGTWHANNGNITIHDDVQDVATIAQDATVILAGSGVINRIGTTLANIEGGFFVNDQSFTSGGTLTADKSSGGPAIIGGNGTIVGDLSGPFTFAPGASSGTFTVEGTADWAGGTTSTDAGGYNFEVFDLSNTSPANAGNSTSWDLLIAESINVDTNNGTSFFLNMSLADGAIVDSAQLMTDFDLLIAQADSEILLLNTLNFVIDDAELQALIDPMSGSGTFSVVRGDAIGQGNNQAFLSFDFQAVAVPEPASITIWTLFSLALAGFGLFRLRRKK